MNNALKTISVFSAGLFIGVIYGSIVATIVTIAAIGLP